MIIKQYKHNLKELDIEIEIKKIITDGDLVLDRRTSEIGGKGEFIKNIEKEGIEFLSVES